MLNKSIIKDFFINLLLHSQNFSFDNLGINSSLDEDSVINWVNGNYDPTMPQLQEIAKIFHVKLIELFKSAPSELDIIKESLNSINAKLDKIINKVCPN